jgi:hypothetical protein
MPGWLLADDVVRKRIVVAAMRYLAQAASKVDSWLGGQRNSPERSVAALRALLLLRQVDTIAYRALPTTIWKKWAPVIVGLPRHGVVDNCPDAQAMTRDTLANAPTEFIGAVVAMIQAEKTSGRSVAVRPNSASRFDILRDLEGCWDDETLKIALFQELTAPDLTSSEYAALLDALLKVEFEPAIEHAVAALGAPDRDAVVIATVILNRAPVRAWPALWTRLTQNDDLARAMLLQAAGQFRLGTPF